jgi:predicted DNA-binding transcriptional regulator AlpA
MDSRKFKRANDEELISPKKAAQILGTNENVMAIWRHRGEGPDYYKLSRRAIRYLKSDIYQWLRSRKINCAGD